MTPANHSRRLFCDFGEDFIVEDPTEVEPMTAAVQDISQVGAECRDSPDIQRKVPGPVEGRYRHSEIKLSLT